MSNNSKAKALTSLTYKTQSNQQINNHLKEEVPAVEKVTKKVGQSPPTCEEITNKHIIQRPQQAKIINNSKAIIITTAVVWVLNKMTRPCKS